MQAILKADLVSLIKFGIVAGVGIATIVLIFKFIRDKKKSYSNEEDTSLVDRALELNFNDLRQQEELHPLMKKVHKAMNKELKPRKVKSSKRKSLKRKRNKDIIEQLLERRRSRTINDELDKFLASIPEMEEFEREVVKYPANCTLRNVWDNC